MALRSILGMSAKILRIRMREIISNCLETEVDALLAHTLYARLGLAVGLHFDKSVSIPAGAVLAGLTDSYTRAGWKVMGRLDHDDAHDCTVYILNPDRAEKEAPARADLGSGNPQVVRKDYVVSTDGRGGYQLTYHNEPEN